MVLLLTLSVAIPESEAKRMGSGRSSGRQAPIARQRSTPPQPPRSAQAVPPAPSAPPQSRPAPVDPVASRPAAPAPSQPLSPQRTLPREAASPWGGMLGGALIGLGLGSLISRSNGDNVVNQNESSGSGTSGENESTGGASGNYGDEQVLRGPEATSNPLGPLLLLGLLAMVVFYVVRRVRRRSH
ncbi:hypothetical protein [Noviherbaspirillum sp. Root189]|uniref:hypothetical protein n=1 Tax=Noviherbaspirillum sp. Root189 TaxID=1736487 RepID=UPI00138ECC2F|nr:hypothetical protein [Noviherbaspirillum sp. Root189]